MSDFIQGWDQCVGNASSAGTGEGTFVRLQDGDTIKVVFCGEPLARRVVWDQAVGHSVDFDPAIHQEREGKQKFLFNVYDTAEKRVRILELSQRTFIDVAKLRKSNGGTLENCLVRISRKGSGKETIYWSEIDRALEPEQVAKVASVYGSDAYDLGDIVKGGDGSNGSNGYNPAPPAPVAAPVAAPAPANDFDLF